MMINDMKKKEIRSILIKTTTTMTTRSRSSRLGYPEGENSIKYSRSKSKNIQKESMILLNRCLDSEPTTVCIDVVIEPPRNGRVSFGKKGGQPLYSGPVPYWGEMQIIFSKDG